MKLYIIQVNIHKHKNTFGYKSKWLKPNSLYIYCGRSNVPNPNSLGNPYPVNNATSRKQSIKLFSNYYITTPTSKKFNEYIFELVNANKLKELYLWCFCKPKECHTDVIKKELTKSLQIKGVLC